MKIIQLFFQEFGKVERKLITLIFFKSVTFLWLLILINEAVDLLGVGEFLGFHYFLLTLFFLGLVTFLDHRLADVSAQWAGKCVQQIRLQLIDKLRRMDLLDWERVKSIEAEPEMGKERIYHLITSESEIISTALIEFIFCLEGLAALLIALGYLTWYSSFTSLYLLLTFAVMMLIFKRNRGTIREGLFQERREATRLIGLITHFMEGFAEIKVNQQKNEGLFYSSTVNCLENMRKLEISMGKKQVMNQVLCGYLYFMFLFVFAFFLVVSESGSAFSQLHSMTLLATLIFMYAQFRQLVEGWPLLENATVSFQRLEELEIKLTPDPKEQTTQDGSLRAPRILPSFERLQLRELTFQYPAIPHQTAFGIGPLNLCLSPGEIVFIVGENGAGKTTLLKLLTGLYAPSSGVILLNQQPIWPWDYRNLFSVIFSDFHLFDRLYGLDSINHEEVEQWLRTMKLEFETGLVDDHFDNLRLSTGQRKRLALIVGLLENKPIYVFDEWAAEQSPEFRNFFYQTFLGELKAQGKTVVAITHDDPYFHLADRVYRLDSGKLFESPEGVAG